jgi:hypothetical protein
MSELSINAVQRRNAPFRENALFYSMARRQSIRSIRRSRHAAVWVVYLLVCGSIVSAGAMLGVTGLRLSSKDPQTAPPPALEIPVTRIQLFPDRDNLCRTLLFHNDSGRYQEGGTGQCTIPKDMLVWTLRSRTEAFAEAFKSSWKGDSAASPP